MKRCQSPSFEAAVRSRSAQRRPEPELPGQLVTQGDRPRAARPNRQLPYPL